MNPYFTEPQTPDDIIIGAGDGAFRKSQTLSGESIANVITFGAKADGKSDDTTAIQSAINSLSNGGIVIFPKIGQYRYTSIIVPSNVTLEMLPIGIRYSSSLEQPYALKRLPNQTGFGIIFENYSAFKNIIVEGNHSGDGVSIGDNCQGSGLFVFRSGGTGISYGGINIIDRIHSAYNDGDGIKPLKSDNLISNIYIYGNKGHGLNIGTGISNTVYMNGKIEWNDGHNITLYQSTENYFTNIIIDRSGLNGVHSVQGIAYFNNCRLWRSYSSSTIPNEGRAHIHAEGGTKLYFIGGNFNHGKNDDGTGNDTPESIVTGWSNTTNDSEIHFIGINSPIGSINDILNAYSGNTIKIVNTGSELLETENRITMTSLILEQYTTANRPINPLIGQTILDKTLGYPVTYNGTNWVNGNGTVV